MYCTFSSSFPRSPPLPSSQVSGRPLNPVPVTYWGDVLVKLCFQRNSRSVTLFAYFVLVLVTLKSGEISNDIANAMVKFQPANPAPSETCPKLSKLNQCNYKLCGLRFRLIWNINILLYDMKSQIEGGAILNRAD